ncbi:MAG: VWA domain-containing protein [Clostridiales Family XIII bacterium]|jgi:Ca-activated chloride channel family protein|nr:VWA domain-containing protein [Clostridiales Family XIII bacterium]
MNKYSRVIASKSRFRITNMVTAILLIGMMTFSLVACSSGYEEGKDYGNLSKKDANKTLDAYLSKIDAYEIDAPIDISGNETPVAELPDIGIYPLSVDGSGSINIEIFSSTEKSSTGNDGWLNEVATAFNDSGATIDGKSVNVSIRPIASGLALDYITTGKYIPDAFSPANELWGQMIESKNIPLTKVENRLAGNTAGILMKQSVYDKFKEEYSDVNLTNALKAAMAGDITLAYTNPYASSTGLNMLTAMLHEFDPENPLSEKAQQALLDFQALSPPVAFTTAQMRESAKNGMVDAMIMEYQAYINEPTLKNFVFTEMGVRHDSPVYTFEDTSADKTAGLKLFTEYAKSDSMQKMASDFGFNANDAYQAQNPGLDGAGLYAAQDIWKEKKDGGKPVIAVFVADISGSMDGSRINALKESLINGAQYIGENNYIGLVSYSDDVYINLPIDKFSGQQRAKFNGAVKEFSVEGGTATYDGVLVGLDMLRTAEEKYPGARTMLFVLSDGEQNEGYNFKKVAPVIAALNVPIHTIGYEANIDELKKLSAINEASATDANEKDIVYNLKNIFNAQI